MDPKDYAEWNENVKVEQNIRDISDAACTAKSKLRLRIDLFVVPTITLLYLKRFVDCTNIGMKGRPETMASLTTMTR